MTAGRTQALARARPAFSYTLAHLHIYASAYRRISIAKQSWAVPPYTRGFASSRVFVGAVGSKKYSGSVCHFTPRRM